MTTIDALSYTYLVFTTTVYALVIVNFTWFNRAGTIDLLVPYWERKNKDCIEPEGCGTFFWDNYFGCYFGGNNDFLVYLGGGCFIPPNAPIPAAGEILVSDLLDVGTKNCILAHERGHKEVGSARHDNFFLFIWEEIKADHYAIKQVGREFYWQHMMKHAFKVKEATRYGSVWGDVLYWRNMLIRAIFILLWT